MLQGTAHVYCIAMLPGSISTDLSVKALHAMTDGVPSKVTFASFLQFRKASESMIHAFGNGDFRERCAGKSAFANLCDSLWNVDIVFFSNVF